MRLDEHRHKNERHTRLYRILQQQKTLIVRVRRFSLLATQPPAFKFFIFRGKCEENARENFPFSMRQAKLEKYHLKIVKCANVRRLIWLHVFSPSMQIINDECKTKLRRCTKKSNETLPDTVSINPNDIMTTMKKLIHEVFFLCVNRNHILTAIHYRRLFQNSN